MTCVPPTTHGHREHDVCTSAFDAPCHYFHANSSTDATASDGGDLVPAMVTKLFDRREWTHHPKTFDAIKDKGKALVSAKTWLEDSVTEKADLIRNANEKGETIHMGNLLTLCSIKHSELCAALQKYKGRICFRGDDVRDEKGALAVFQELSSHPTAIQTANSNIAGCLPGNCTTQTDAVRAYLQRKLK